MTSPEKQTESSAPGRWVLVHASRLRKNFDRRYDELCDRLGCRAVSFSALKGSDGIPSQTRFFARPKH